jgi:hypothetical protein
VLDAGERDAIALAQATKADLLLRHDQGGVTVARRRGFAVTGTLGLLDLAARKGLVDLAVAFTRLKATSFYYRPEQTKRSPDLGLFEKTGGSGTSAIATTVAQAVASFALVDAAVVGDVPDARSAVVEFGPVGRDAVADRDRPPLCKNGPAATPYCIILIYNTI